MQKSIKLEFYNRRNKKCYLQSTDMLFQIYGNVCKLDPIQWDDIPEYTSEASHWNGPCYKS